MSEGFHCFTGQVEVMGFRSPLSSPKTASLVGSIGQGRPIESCGARMATQDDPLAAKMAEGMRSTSAGGVFLWLLSLHEQ